MLKALFNTSWVGPLIAAIATAIYGVAIYIYVRTQRRRIAQKRSRLNSAFSSGLSRKSLVDISDFRDVLIGVLGPNVEADRVLAQVLREFLAELHGGELSAISGSYCKEWTAIVKPVIAQCEAVAPFADLPQPERVLITEASNLVQQGGSVGVAEKLNELARAISVRDQELQMHAKRTRWSIPLAIFGCALTVFFGVLSVWLYARGG